jgi:hypothetical protein
VGLLLILNLCALITDSFKPSPIVFFTLLNIYLFICFAAILGFELFETRVTPATARQRERRPRARRK